ncbi:MAG: ABC transporter ATP-binding protein [Candidatus Marinimicrobia bacterium]|nr:ABC transporter ATP-binding protein [Candidatus Neomarinimicrobiota bacterium]
MSIFSAHDLTISFGGIKALNHVSFEIEKGAVYSIIGPNGAGKTTIFNCISGLYAPDHGEIIFQDMDITNLAPYKIAGLGIARTFQNIELFSRMTTMENLMLGRHLHMKTGLWSGVTLFSSNSKVSREEIVHRERVEIIVDLLDLQSARDVFVGELPYGSQKLVELARALALEPKLLLLDEPSSGMNNEEKHDLFYWIKDIRNLFDVTILMIEHDMNMVRDISDKVLAINFGKKITAGTPDEVANHPEVLKAYLGEEDA